MVLLGLHLTQNDSWYVVSLVFLVSPYFWALRCAWGLEQGVGLKAGFQIIRTLPTWHLAECKRRTGLAAC